MASPTKSYLKIRHGLMKRGLSMAGIARKLQCGRAAVTLVAQGKRNSRRIQNALARAVGIKRKELWG